MDNVTPLIAFTGGILSLLSPCVLPMLPVYLASLAGPELFESGVAGRRLTVFLHSLCFIAGFSVVFILLGTGAGLAGFAISAKIGLVRKISGSIMIIFGLVLLASPRVSWLNYEKRLTTGQGVTGGYLRSLLLGVIFSLAWTPCVGPVLGGILTLAFNSESGWDGGYLLAIYSAGMALPFLIIGLAFDFVSRVLKNIRRYSSYIYIVSGILLIVVGALILTDNMYWFQTGF